jgi:cysteine desulfurase
MAQVQVYSQEAWVANILSSITNAELNGHKMQRMTNTTNITFHGIESEALLDKEGVCASSSSACLADSDEPSHVIKAMKPPSCSRRMIRFSLGPEDKVPNTKRVLALLEEAVLALSV